MTFAITGGGTGGHLAIARSLRDAALKEGHRCLFIGSQSGQDRSWFEGDRQFESVHFLNTTGVVNKKGIKKLWALWLSIIATCKAVFLLKSVDAVISVGGFSAAPASFAALLSGRPFFIHEQNAAIGRLNRLLRPYARAFFSSYEESSPVKDYPVGESFFEHARIRERIKTIIFLGGSQGARFINELALKIAPLLHEKGIGIIHQAGRLEVEKVRDAYKKIGIEAEVFDFSTDIDRLMQKSDFAVSRSGASTLWELSASCLPALYIPYPYAAGDHQYYNAAYLQREKASWICRQDEDPYAVLVDLLGRDMREASENLKGLIHKDGAVSILKEIERACNIN